MLKIVCQCDIKYIMTSQIKQYISVLGVSAYIITNITACPISLAHCGISDNVCLNLQNCLYSYDEILFNIIKTVVIPLTNDGLHDCRNLYFMPLEVQSK